MALRRSLVSICAFFGLVLVACGGSSHHSIEGDWRLTGGMVNGERKSVSTEKGFVFRFRDGQFSIPVQGGLRDSDLPKNTLSYDLNDEKLELHGDGALTFTVIKLEDNELVLRPPYASTDHPIDFVFTRIN